MSTTFHSLPNCPILVRLPASVLTSIYAQSGSGVKINLREGPTKEDDDEDEDDELDGVAAAAAGEKRTTTTTTTTTVPSSSAGTILRLARVERERVCVEDRDANFGSSILKADTEAEMNVYVPHKGSCGKRRRNVAPKHGDDYLLLRCGEVATATKMTTTKTTKKTAKTMFAVFRGMDIKSPRRHRTPPPTPPSHGTTFRRVDESKEHHHASVGGGCDDGGGGGKEDQGARQRRLKEVGKKLRRRLEEERKRRKEIVLLDDNGHVSGVGGVGNHVNNVDNESDNNGEKDAATETSAPASLTGEDGFGTEATFFPIDEGGVGRKRGGARQRKKSTPRFGAISVPAHAGPKRDENKTRTKTMLKKRTTPLPPRPRPRKRSKRTATDGNDDGKDSVPVLPPPDVSSLSCCTHPPPPPPLPSSSYSFSLQKERRLSRVVRVHGLPTIARPEDVGRLFSGLDPTRILVLPRNDTHVKDFDAPSHANVPTEGGNKSKSNSMHFCRMRHSNTFRVLVAFRSVPVAEMAVERSGEVVRCTSPLANSMGASEGADASASASAVTVAAAVAVTPVPTDVADFFLHRMAINGVKGESLSDTFDTVMGQLHPIVGATLWAAAYKIMGLLPAVPFPPPSWVDDNPVVQRERGRGRGREKGRGRKGPSGHVPNDDDDDDDDDDDAAGYEEPRQRHNKLARRYNSLWDAHEQLEMDSTPILIRAYDPEVATNDDIVRLTASASDWILDDMDKMRQAMLAHRRAARKGGMTSLM